MSEKRISIIIPAWNEEALIAQTLDALVAASAALPVVETIVVDNNSSDATAAIAEAHGARVVFEPHNQIARARNCGARHALGEYLFFIDADTLPSAAILAAGYRELMEGAVAVGSAVNFDEDIHSGWKMLAALWNKISHRFDLAAGSFLLCEREAFEEVGGFPLNAYAGEEVILSRRLKKWGRSCGRSFAILRGYEITTSARKFAGFGAVSCILQTLLILLFPWLVRWRLFCWLWYRRS